VRRAPVRREPFQPEGVLCRPFALSRKLVVAVTLAAGAAAAFCAAVATHASPAGAVSYPTARPNLPAKTIYLSSADAAPGPGYSRTSRHFVPSGIEHSYNLPPLYAQGYAGQGKTIAIVDSVGYPQAAADLETFSDAFGLPEMCGMPDVTCKPGMPTFSTLQFGNRPAATTRASARRRGTVPAAASAACSPGPSYQGSLPAGSTAIPASARGVPDISMDASCTTWAVVLDTAPGFGGYYGVCGTSAASPMFSGLVAIADQYAGRDLGQINGALYELASSSAGSSAVFDVTDGNNVQAGTGIAGCSAGAGWDAVTGLGTPNGANFVPALVAAANS
jgi:subtilase family serine protease